MLSVATQKHPASSGPAGLLVLLAVSCRAPEPAQQPAVPHDPPPIAEVETTEAPEPRPRLSRLRVTNSGGCVVDEGKRVLCWGNDLRHPNSRSDHRGIARALELGNDLRVVDIDINTNGRQVCALSQDGHLRCLTSTGYDVFERTGTTLSLGADVRERCVLDGMALTCAANDARPITAVVDVDHWRSILCVLEQASELDRGPTLWCRRPGGRPIPYGLAADAVDVEVGDSVPCVRNHGGLIECPGGRLRGTGGTNPPPLAELAGFTDVAAFDLGDEHLCALTSAGEVRCAGGNDWGQLGAGDSLAHDEPVTVELPGPAHEIAVAATQSCALVGEQVLCWGTDGVGSREQRYEQVRHELTTNGIFVAGGLSCARSPGGRVQCWGDAYEAIDDRFGGIVAGSAPREASFPRSFDSLHIGAILSGQTLRSIDFGDDLVAEEYGWTRKGVRDVAAQPAYLCLVEGTRLSCYEDEVDRLVPFGSIDPLSGISAASLSNYSLCAIQSAGGVRCHPFEEEDGRWTTIRGVSRVRQLEMIDDDEDHVCALTASHQLVCWAGAMDYDNGGAYVVTQGPLEIPVAGKPVAIAPGSSLFVLTAAGALLSARVPEILEDFEPFEPVIPAGVVEIAGSPSHTCARVDEDGDGTTEVVICIGDNSFGQLGRLGAHVRLKPSPITIPEAAAQ